MLRSRLASTTKKINSLTELMNKIEVGVKVLEVATYRTYLQEESKILVSIEGLRTKIESLENEMTIFEKAESEIKGDEELTKKYDAQIERILEAIEKGNEVLSSLRAHQKRLEAMGATPKPELQTIQDDSERPPSQTPNFMPHNSTLPQIKIPKFNGDRWEWTNFWTIFTEVIDKTALSPLLKLNTLINHLEGEAKELGKRYQLTGDNYAKVVGILKERYDDKTATINELNKKLIEARSSDYRKIEAQRKLWDAIRTIVDQLKGLGEDVESTMLKNLVVKKFNYQIQENVFDSKLELKDESKWTMEFLTESIERSIKRSEYIAMQLGKPEPEKEESKDDKKKKEKSKSTPKESEKSDEKSTKTNKKYSPCVYCEGTHFPNKCPKVTDAKERAKILEKKKACKGCFRVDTAHKKNECDSRFLCKKGCTESHHFSLCPKAKKQTKNESDDGKIAATKETAHANIAAAEAKVTLSTSECEIGKEERTGDQTEVNETTTPREDQINVTAISVPRDEAFLATLKTKAYNKRSKEWKNINILLDCGANKTFADNDLMESLDLKETGSVKLQVQSFGNEEPKTKTYRRSKIHLRGSKENDEVEIEVLLTNVLAGCMKKAPLSKEDTLFILKNGLQLNEDSLETRVKPNLIIGTDFLKKIWKGEMIDLPSGLTLISTIYGYATMGKSDVQSLQDTRREENEIEYGNENDGCTMMVASSKEGTDNREAMERDIEDRQRNDMSMKTSEEFSGPLTSEKLEMEKETIEFFKKTIEKRNDGYYVRIPFKDEYRNIPNNRAIALKRLINVKKYHNDEVLKMIDDIFNDQVEKGIIERVEEGSNSEGFVHYNPHQPVITPQKTTTKCRVVIDGSSHFKNEKSLNDVIKQGPVILPDLSEMLIRFRSGKIVILSDVEKAFLQVHLHEDDRDATRILWLNDYRLPVSDDNVVAYRSRRVMFGLNVSPYLLAATIEHHLESHEDQDLAAEMRTNLYVDNLMLTTDEKTEEAVRLYQNSKNTFQEMGMNLREFLSNSNEFNEEVDEKDRAKESEMKVLGIPWNAENDEITSSMKVEQAGKLSRRIVAGAIAEEFDPVGFLVPIMLHLKLFQRKLWEETYNWDTPLTNEHREEWDNLIEKRKGFMKKLPRHVISKSGENTLVTFTDASKEATACGTYVVNELGAHLILAKSKVRPLKESWTIPKLETQAITMGVQMTKKVWKALNDGKIRVNEIFILSDSEIALAWLRTKPTRQEVGVLIANRLKTIEGIVSELNQHCPVTFGHVDTKSNPADLGTRGIEREAAQESNWWEGPEFLKLNKDQWPRKESFFQMEAETETITMALGKAKETETEEKRQVLNYKATNSWFKLERTTLYVLKGVLKMTRRFSDERKKLMAQRIPELKKITDGEVTGPEIAAARRVLVKDAQKTITEKDLKKLKDLRPKLNEDGIIICQGRMGRSGLTDEAKEPILILPTDRLATLLIWKAHGKYHNPTDHTMAEVRKTTWIPKLRSLTKSTLKKCVPCQRMTKRSYLYPEVGQLPSFRVNEGNPFEGTGIDHFGPIPIRREDGSIGKAYGTIFTCATTRLIHVEVVQDESTTAFLQAFRKFVALRGLPKTIVSDNAPTFILGSELVTEASKGQSLTSELKEMLQIKEIDWQFISPYSPWKGGFYERLVRSVKEAFKKGIGRTILNMEEMTTVFYEITASINSRPLTYVEEEIDSMGVIRPSDFIYQKFNAHLSMEELEDQDNEYRPSSEAQVALTKTETLKALQSSIETMQKVWKIWREKYLAELREKHRLQIDKKRGHHSIPVKGQMVIICDEDQPRDVWRLGRIVDTIVSQDGAIREVHILVKPQLRKAHIIKRSPNLVVPLELNEDESEEEIQTPNQVDLVDDENKVQQEEKEVEDANEIADRPKYNLRKRRQIDYNEQEEENDMYVGCGIFNTSTTTLLTIVTLVGLFCIPGIGATTAERVIECTNTGVKLLKTYENFEVCVKDYCSSRARMQWTGPTNIWIPLALKTRPHQVRAKVFDGTQIEVHETRCPAVAVCDGIDCTFCAENIMNPECSPIWAWIGLAGALYGLGMLCYCCFRVPITLGGPLTIWWKILKTLVKCVFHQTKKWNESRKNDQKKPKIEVRRPSWATRMAESLVVLMILSLVIPGGYGCQEIDIITQETKECMTNGDRNENCILVTENLIHLNQIQREACIRLNRNGTTFKEIRTKFLRSNLKCLKESVVFTKQIRIEVDSAKRCPHMGSCKEEKCANITRSSWIPELEHTYGHVGNAGCIESCGGPGCDCFFPSSACLFYRIYAKIESEDVFEIFKCLQWDSSMKIAMTTTSLNSIDNKAQTNIIELPLNEPIAVEETTITASVIMADPSPVLGTWFIRNGTEIAVWSNQELPAFQCYTEEKANRNECQLRERCDCKPAETKVTCACQEHNLTEHFNIVQRRLPLQQGHWTLRTFEKSVRAISSEQISTEIVVRTKGTAEIEIIKDNDKCWVEASHITGCYACAEGGHTNLTCMSTNRTTIATVSCLNRTFTLTCSLKGRRQEVNWFSERAQFHENCGVSCGQESTEFHVNGILKYTGSIWTSVYRIIEGKTTIYYSGISRFCDDVRDVFFVFFKNSTNNTTTDHQDPNHYPERNDPGFSTRTRAGKPTQSTSSHRLKVSNPSCMRTKCMRPISVLHDYRIFLILLMLLIKVSVSNYRTTKFGRILNDLIDNRAKARENEKVTQRLVREKNSLIVRINERSTEDEIGRWGSMKTSNLWRVMAEIEMNADDYIVLYKEFETLMSEIHELVKFDYYTAREVDEEMAYREYRSSFERRCYQEEIEVLRRLKLLVIAEFRNIQENVDREIDNRTESYNKFLDRITERLNEIQEIPRPGASSIIIEELEEPMENEVEESMASSRAPTTIEDLDLDYEMEDLELEQEERDPSPARPRPEESRRERSRDPERTPSPVRPRERDRRHGTPIRDILAPNEEVDCGTRCVFCKRRHMSNECGDVPEIEERMIIINRERRCKICINQHFHEECRRQNERCTFCARIGIRDERARHHKALCPRAKNRSRPYPEDRRNPRRDLGDRGDREDRRRGGYDGDRRPGGHSDRDREERR